MCTPIGSHLSTLYDVLVRITTCCLPIRTHSGGLAWHLRFFVSHYCDVSLADAEWFSYQWSRIRNLLTSFIASWVLTNILGIEQVASAVTLMDRISLARSSNLRRRLKVTLWFNQSLLTNEEKRNGAWLFPYMKFASYCLCCITSVVDIERKNNQINKVMFRLNSNVDIKKGPGTLIFGVVTILHSKF